jgi:signal transduction histidine kinase/CheY-like chemotaxis protein
MSSHRFVVPTMLSRWLPRLTHSDNVGFSRERTLALAAAIALMCFAGAAAVGALFRAADAENSVNRTIEIRQQARDLLTIMLNAETGVRGFLLSGDETFLEPYQAAPRQFSETVARLTALTGDSPIQRQSLKAISNTAEQLMDFYRDLLALTGQGKRDGAIERVTLKTGKTLMDDTRTLLDAFSDRELVLLHERQHAASFWEAFLVGSGGGALMLAIGLLVFFARSTFHYIEHLDFRTAELENEARRRRESEETLLQAQKMESVGQLTGGIAHDFNNMLTVIIGNLETLQRRLTRAQPNGLSIEALTALAKPAELALQGAHNASKLTHRLLAFARRQPLAPVRADLNKILSGVSDLLRRTMGEMIVFETVLAAGLWPTFVDVNQLENAVLNLAVNARDAMPNGGHLTIETANSYLDEAYANQFGDVAPGQYVLLSVTDTGTGIPPELMRKIFEPFFTTKDHGRGSGLGLAMVHGFVKQTGGHVRIYSEVNEGTTVKIYLPRLNQAEEVAANPEEAPQHAVANELTPPSETILLVEDNDDVRQYAKSALEELGYKVLVAHDGATALRIVNDGLEIDLLFTDIVLPGGMNGRQLSQEVLKTRPGLAVLYTTGYTPNAIIHHGRLDPDVQLLSKPYTQEDLSRKIRRVLGR